MSLFARFPGNCCSCCCIVQELLIFMHMERVDFHPCTSCANVPGCFDVEPAAFYLSLSDCSSCLKEFTLVSSHTAINYKPNPNPMCVWVGLGWCLPEMRSRAGEIVKYNLGLKKYRPPSKESRIWRRRRCLAISVVHSVAIMDVWHTFGQAAFYFVWTWIFQDRLPCCWF